MKPNELKSLLCPFCGHSEPFTLIHHLRDEHKVSPETFQSQFSEESLCAPEFAAFLNASNVRHEDGLLNYEVSVMGSSMTARHGVDHPLVPEPDATFVLTDVARDVAEAIEHNERLFIYGPSGTGKSTLVNHLAGLTQRPLRRVSLNGETSIADFVGHWTVNDRKETVFVHGILPEAMLHGYILQLDEVDAMQPEVGFVLQQVLEPGGHLLLTDTGEDVAPHPDFRIVATANTLGFGSDSGLYTSGTNTLNFSWIDRWDVVVHVDYLPQNLEVNLLKTRFPAVDRRLLKQIVKGAGDLRRAHAEEQLTTVPSTRRLLALCARLARGNEFQRALTVCMLNKVPSEDVKVIREAFQHHVGIAT